MKPSERKRKTAEAAHASRSTDPLAADTEADLDANAEANPSGRPPDIVCQLWFDQFQHMSTLATAATAGGLILLQTPYLEATLRAGIAVVIFVLAAAIALIGQTKLIDRVHSNREIGTEVRVYRILTVALMGAGTGIFVAIIAS